MASTKKLSGNIEGIADRPLDRFTKRAGVLRTSPSCFAKIEFNIVAGFVGKINELSLPVLILSFV